MVSFPRTADHTADVWTTPHFDFHYYFVDETAVDDIVTSGPLPFMGVATYDLPAPYWPDHFVYDDPRFIVKAMGEHHYDERSPQWDPDVPFTHTYIYGAYDFSIDPPAPDGTVELPLDPDGGLIDLPTYAGDGTGQLTFTEPMITEAFMRDVAASTAGEVRRPSRFRAHSSRPGTTRRATRPATSGGPMPTLSRLRTSSGSTPTRPDPDAVSQRPPASRVRLSVAIPLGAPTRYPWTYQRTRAFRPAGQRTALSDNYRE